MTYDHLLTAPEFYVNPYPAYSIMRENAPVCWSDAWGGWVLTRYADVVATLRDHRRFSNAGRIDKMLAALPPDGTSSGQTISGHFAVNIGHVDPPDHTRIRSLLQPAFGARRLERMRARVQAVVDELLDEVDRRGDGRMDLIADFSFPLPAIVVSEMIGAPVHDRDKFRDWGQNINQVFSGVGRTSREKVDLAERNLAEIRAYTTWLASQRRKEPTDDLVSLMVQAEDQTGRLSEAELVSATITLFVAGHETTTFSLGNGMVALLRHPEQLALLRERPELMEAAVEEIFRYDTPVQRGWRVTREDTEIAGQPVQAGQLVLPMEGAANHDPAQFPDPDRFDITRQDNRHLTFGFGIHFCIGAPLARIELPIALAELLKRYPKLRLANEQIVWRRDVAMRGPEGLELLLD